MRVLGIDYGRKKIGLAVGEMKTGLVEPVGTVISYNLQVISYLQKLIIKEEIKLLVVGLPGGEIDEEIKTFGRELEKEIGLAVEFFDETLTTQDAQKILGQIGRNKKYKKTMEDAIAAAVMLKSYLERGSHV